MYQNLFDQIHERFFTVLTHKNKRCYADCLLALHHEYQTMMPEQFTYTVVLEIVRQTLSECGVFFDPLDIDDDMEQDEDNVQSQSEFVEYRIVRRLKKCGWFEIMPDESNELIVSFTDAAMTILPKLNELAHPNRVSLGGYTRNIVSNLKSLKTTKNPYTDAFIHAFNQTEEFMKVMERIRIEIKRDIQKILLCDDYVQMNEMLSEYLEKNLSGDYYRVQFEEGLDAESRREISDCIIETKLNESLMEKLIDGAINHQGMSRADAESHIYTRLDMMYEHLCRRYDERYNRILREQRKYINNASAKLNAYAVDRKNVRGMIKGILVEINKEPSPDDWASDIDIFWLDQLRKKFSVPGAVYLDETSIYRAKKASVVSSGDIEVIPVEDPSEEVFINSVRSTQSLYTPKKVQKMIEKYMGDQTSLSARSLPLETSKDFTNLVAMVIMTKGDKSPFDIKFSDTHIENGNFVVPDFCIYRKDKKGME